MGKGQRAAVVAAVVAAVAILAAGVALAAENPLLVTLPQQINSSVSKILTLQRSADRQVKAQEQQIQQVVQQIESASGQAEIYALQKEYLALRAETLKAHAEKAVGIEQELAKIAHNLERLDRVRRDSEKFGLGPGILRDDASKQAVAEVLQGYGALVSMVETVNPGASLGDLKVSLNTLNGMARTFFSTSNDVASLEAQKRFVKEAMIAAKSVQRVLGLEHDYLLRNLFYVDARHLVHQFGELRTAVLGEGLDFSQQWEDLHRQDEQVLQMGAEPADASAGPTNRIDSSAWGRF